MFRHKIPYMVNQFVFSLDIPAMINIFIRNDQISAAENVK